MFHVHQELPTVTLSLPVWTMSSHLYPFLHYDALYLLLGIMSPWKCFMGQSHNKVRSICTHQPWTIFLKMEDLNHMLELARTSKQLICRIISPPLSTSTLHFLTLQWNYPDAIKYGKPHLSSLLHIFRERP